MQKPLPRYVVAREVETSSGVVLTVGMKGDETIFTMAIGPGFYSMVKIGAITLDVADAQKEVEKAPPKGE